MRPGTWTCCTVFVAWVLSASIPTSQQKPQVPTFHGAITLVPVDVRVIDDATGRPVGDLKQEDFTIFEDDVRQEIRHFVKQEFGAEALRADEKAPAAPGASLARRESPLSLVPQNNRVFLIVLGNGRLQGGPSKQLDALLQFVRTRLSPNDVAAMFAYNRATDFTADHEKTAQVIERFRQQNDAISAEIDHAFSGLAAVYGSQELPEWVQARIDWVFTGSGTLPFTKVGSAENARTGDRTARDRRQRIEGAIDDVIAAGRMSAASESGDLRPAAVNWATFDAFVSEVGQTLRDTGNLYAAIAYMRSLEGEKHLIFVTTGGMEFSRVEDATDLTRIAADARVAIDVVATGGGVFANVDLRSIARETGGVSSIAERGQVAFDRVDRVTRTGYLLGYYPTNTTWNAAFRKVVVKVNRPHVTVLYRNGYHAFTTIPGFDRQEYMTRFRLEAAASHEKDVKDIRVTLRASLRAAEGRTVADIDARIDPSHIYFNTRSGIRYGRLAIAVMAMDETRTVIGGTYKKMVAHLEYTDETFAWVKKNGIPYQVRIPMPANTRYVRVVLYDYMADLVGSAGSSVF